VHIVIRDGSRHQYKFGIFLCLCMKNNIWNSPQILHPASKLSMLFLKMSTDGDDFTESGKAFHSSTTLTYQKIFPTSVLAFSPQ
jgi:hypothetical protein